MFVGCNFTKEPLVVTISRDQTRRMSLQLSIFLQRLFISTFQKSDEILMRDDEITF